MSEVAVVLSNNPPDDLTILRERLEDEAASLIERRDELLGSVERCPSDIQDEETAGKVSDLVKLISALHKNSEATRGARKEPFLASGRLVDSFYKKITDPLTAGKQKIEGYLTAYQRRKAEAERKRREEEARRQAEEAERAAQEAVRRAEALAHVEDLDVAIEAEEAAKQAQADAEAARKAAEAKPAELSRTRGDFGSVASLRTYWDFADLDRKALDLEMLRPHLPQDALEKAIRSFIKAGGRQLGGVKIFENTHAVVR